MSTSADCPFVRQLTVADLLATVALRGTVTVSSRQALSSRNPTRTSRLLDGTHGVVAYGVVEASALLAIELLRIPDENHSNVGFSFHLVPEEVGRSMCASSRTKWFYQRHGAVGFNECLSPPNLSCSIGKAVGMRSRSPSELRELGKFSGKRNINSA